MFRNLGGKGKSFLVLLLIVFLILGNAFLKLAQEMYQSLEVRDDLYKTTFFVRGELGISSWDTEEKWYEGTDTLARMCGIQNKHLNAQREVNYHKVYFLDGQSYEFWEMMVRLSNMEWDDPRREEIVDEVQKFKYSYSMGGRFRDTLFVDKGIYIREGDYEKVLKLLREEVEADWIFDKGEYYILRDG